MKNINLQKKIGIAILAVVLFFEMLTMGASSNVSAATDNSSISYTMHVQNIGWQDWVKNGQTAGTTGQALSIQAVEIKLQKKQITRRALVLGETSSPQVPKEDVTSMVGMLKNNNFDGSKISVQSYQNQSKDFITKAIGSAFAGAKDSDISYLYMTCHGNPDGSIAIDKSNPYTASELRTILDQVKGTVVLMLDCCYSGSSIDKSCELKGGELFMKQFQSNTTNLKANKYKVICSSSKGETSLGASQYLGTKVSLATNYWELGAGWNASNNTSTSLNADTNSDKLVTLNELCAYSSPKVTDDRNRWNNYNKQRDPNYIATEQTVVCYPSNSDFVLFSR